MYCVGSDRDHMCCPRQAAAAQHRVQLMVVRGRGRGRGRGVFTSAAAPVTRPGAGRGRGEAEQEKAEAGPATAAARDHAATTATWPPWQQSGTLPSIGATNTGCPVEQCAVSGVYRVLCCVTCVGAESPDGGSGAARRSGGCSRSRSGAGRGGHLAQRGRQWLVRGEPPAGPEFVSQPQPWQQ